MWRFTVSYERQERNRFVVTSSFTFFFFIYQPKTHV